MTATRVRHHPAYGLDVGEVRALLGWLGAWPNARRLRVAPSARRIVSLPGRGPDLLAGVVGDARQGHATVVSVPPLAFPQVRTAVRESMSGTRLAALDELFARLPAAIGRPRARVVVTPVRWTAAPLAVGRVDEVWSPAEGGAELLRGKDGAAAVLRSPLGPAAVALRLACRADAHPTLPAALLARAAQDALDVGLLPVLDVDGPATARTATTAGFLDSGWSRLSLDSHEHPIRNDKLESA